ncbi:hypothetical protein HDV00_003659 [Rhizophlyctis rosea]|nr:hypothetical protein HDV00_003659 [Rhizophlyctis rosea]
MPAKQLTSLFATVLTKVPFVRQKRKQQQQQHQQAKQPKQHSSSFYHTESINSSLISLRQAISQSRSAEPQPRPTKDGADSGYGSASIDRKNWLRSAGGSEEADRVDGGRVESHWQGGLSTIGEGGTEISSGVDTELPSSSMIPEHSIVEISSAVSTEQPSSSMILEHFTDDTVDQTLEDTVEDTLNATIEETMDATLNETFNQSTDHTPPTEPSVSTPLRSSIATFIIHEDAEQPALHTTPYSRPSLSHSRTSLNQTRRVSFDTSSRRSGKHSIANRSVRSRRKRAHSEGKVSLETVYYTPESEPNRTVLVTDSAVVKEEVPQRTPSSPQKEQEERANKLKRLSWETFCTETTEEKDLPPPPADRVLPSSPSRSSSYVTATESETASTAPSRLPVILPAWQSGGREIVLSKAAMSSGASISSQNAVIDSREGSLDWMEKEDQEVTSDVFTPDHTLVQTPASSPGRPVKRGRISDLDRSQLDVDWSRVLEVPGRKMTAGKRWGHVRKAVKWAKKVLTVGGGRKEGEGGSGFGFGEEKKGDWGIGVGRRNTDLGMVGVKSGGKKGRPYSLGLSTPDRGVVAASLLPTTPLPSSQPSPSKTSQILSTPTTASPSRMKATPSPTSLSPPTIRPTLRRSISLHSLRHHGHPTTSRKPNPRAHRKRASIDVVSTGLRRLYYDVCVKGVDLNHIAAPKSYSEVSSSLYDNGEWDKNSDEEESEWEEEEEDGSAIGAGRMGRSVRARAGSDTRRNTRRNRGRSADMKSIRSGRTVRTFSSSRTLTSVLTGSDVVVALRYLEAAY